MEEELDHLRATTSEQRLGSVMDGRRRALARGLLRADPDHAVALHEVALAAFYSFEWVLNRVRRTGLGAPGSGAWPRSVRHARDRVLDRIEAALVRDPTAWWAHELRVRVHVLLGDDDALGEAAREALAARPDDPRALLLVGVAAHRSGDADASEEAVGTALAALPPEESARYTDVRPILSAAERDAYEADPTGFEQRYWASRDPRLLSAANERWLEHVSRVVLADVLFRDPYGRGPGSQTDQGRTYVRYGPPRVGTWAFLLGKGAQHTWVYDGFGFVFDDLSSYGDVVHADGLPARVLANRLGSQYRYVPSGGTFGVPVLASRFRDADGSTSVIVGIGVPVRDDVEDGRPMRLRAGVFVADAAGAVVEGGATEVEGRAVALRATRRGRVWNAGRVVRRPAAGESLVVEVEQPGARIFGRADLPLPPPLPPGPDLVLSDLLLASVAQEARGVAESGPMVRRGEFEVRPVAVAEFRVGDPVVLYWEAYGLALDGERSHYEVVTELVPERRGGIGGAIARALGRGARAGVSVGYEGSGDGEVGDYVVMDASGQEPGAYVLTVRVRDLVSGRVASSSRAVVLLPSP